MIIDLTKLNSRVEECTEIDMDYSFTKEQLVGTSILSLDNVKIYGQISKDSFNDYYLDLTIKGVMILPCAITLEPVSHKFTIQISDTLATILEEIDKNVKKIENSLDIFPIVWENILMEIPMRVVSDKINTIPLEGEGWRFIRED